jgi:MFS-type transporter involved in bile tolerance (Atg22 family)
VGVLQARTGNSRAGYLLMAVALIVSGLIMLFGFSKPTQGTAQDMR